MAQNTKNWYIFRHGLATLSKMGYGSKILTAEVLPEGIPPVRRLGTYMKTLPYDHGRRSELIRCQQTAAIVTEATGNPFTSDSRINEQVQESFETVKARVTDFVKEMSESEHQHIWVCTHGIIIAALKNLILYNEFTPADELDYVLPGQLLKITGQDFEVVKFDELY